MYFINIKYNDIPENANLEIIKFLLMYIIKLLHKANFTNSINLNTKNSSPDTSDLFPHTYV